MAFLQAQIFSNTLNMTTPINVIIPSTKNVNDMPVLYLLHGLSDNHSNWIRRTNIELFADEYECIVVMPEVQRSFYADMVNGLNYFSYITDDLPKILKQLFGISTEREKTYVAGLSMGGYGALKCAFTYPERYCAVAAFSSVADLQASVLNKKEGGIFNMGEFTAIFGGEEIGENNDLFFLLDKLVKQKAQKPKVFLSCGTLDELYPQNIKLRDELMKNDFDPNYIEWAADHSWDFWNASIKIAMDCFFGK